MRTIEEQPSAQPASSSERITEQGPAARRLETEDDVRDAIELLRLNYERAVARVGVAQESAG